MHSIMAALTVAAHLQEMVNLCDNAIAETAGFNADVNNFPAYLKVHRISTVTCVTYVTPCDTAMMSAIADNHDE